MGTDKNKLAKEHAERMKRIELTNLEREYREQEREALKPKSNRKMSASKLLMIGIILVCLEIVIFAEWIMATRDSSALYVLIGIPAALAASFWAYASKSKAENTQGGIVYEATMEELRHQEEEMNYSQYDEENDGAVG